MKRNNKLDENKYINISQHFGGKSDLEIFKFCFNNNISMIIARKNSSSFKSMKMLIDCLQKGLIDNKISEIEIRNYIVAMCEKFTVNSNETFKTAKFRRYIFGHNIKTILVLDEFMEINVIIKDAERYIKENYIHVPKHIKQKFLNSIARKVSLKEIAIEYKDRVGRDYRDFLEFLIFNENYEEDFKKYLEFVMDTLINDSVNGEISPANLIEFIFETSESAGNFFSGIDKLYKLFIEVVFPRLCKKYKEKNSRRGIYKLLGYSENEIEYYEKKLNKYDVRKINSMSLADVERYVEDIIKLEFLDKRERITKAKVFLEIVDSQDNGKMSHNYRNLRYYNQINYIVENSIKKMDQIYIDGNLDEMNLDKKVWKIYYKNHLSLYRSIIDLSELKSEALRKELFNFLKSNFTQDSARDILNITLKIKSTLLILEQDFGITRIVDIQEYHLLLMIHILQIRNKNSIKTVSSKLSALSRLFDFYINETDYKHRPKINYCEGIRLINVDCNNKNTKPIPEEVQFLIDKYSSDIKEVYRLIFKLLCSTGCRYSEIIQLKINSFELDNYDNNYAIMTYTPNKIKKAMKRKGLPEKLLTHIPIELYHEILDYISSTQKTRDKLGINNIFFAVHNGKAVDITSANLNLALNKVIDRRNIISWDGTPWSYVSRQNRKTVAVDLISNNATLKEVQHALGHISQQTTEQYYAEVNKMKLAELNSEFYLKRFNHIIGEKNLDLYSEEERKLLYVDFCLNNREVEFGNCMKHFSEGTCKSLGRFNCSTCPKLCTGMKYLKKWESLLTSTQKIVDDLIKIYEKNDIKENKYLDFIEYKREIYLLNHYNAVVDAIKEKNKEVSNG